MPDMHEKYHLAVSAISEMVSKTDNAIALDVKRTSIYMNWINEKTNLLRQEKTPFNPPERILPIAINPYSYGAVSPDDRAIIDKYYTFNAVKGTHERNATALNPDEKIRLIQLFLLSRGCVAWFEFGFNIGCEFGGKHPALIMKNLGDCLYVVPISSQRPAVIRNYHAEIRRIYNFKPMERWANITRLMPVSILRVDFAGTFGSVDGSVLSVVAQKIRDQWK